MGLAVVLQTVTIDSQIVVGVVVVRPPFARSQMCHPLATAKPVNPNLAILLPTEDVAVIAE